MMARTMILAAVAAVGLTGSSRADGKIPNPGELAHQMHPRTMFGPNFAGEDYPYRGNFWYNAGFRKWPAVLPASATAPWYLWWPADANQSMMLNDFQTSPYPTWQVPPQAAPGPVGASPSRSPTPFYPASYPPTPMNFYSR